MTTETITLATADREQSQELKRANIKAIRHLEACRQLSLAGFYVTEHKLDQARDCAIRALAKIDELLGKRTSEIKP